MEENPVAHPGVPEETYHVLGGRTLMIFVLDRIQGAIVLFALSIIFFVFVGQGSLLAQLQIPNITLYLYYAAWGLLILATLFFLLSFFVAWLIYINYKFFLGEDSLKIKRGILNKEEVAIPYRQIQDVDIDRDLGFRMLGVSRIVILTAGHEDEPKTSESGESEGILPALDKDLAEWMQTELLKRANIQKVTEVDK